MTRTHIQTRALLFALLSAAGCVVDKVKLPDDAGGNHGDAGNSGMDAASNASANGREGGTSSGTRMDATTDTGVSTGGDAQPDASREGGGPLACATDCNTAAASWCDGDTGKCARCKSSPQCSGLPTTPACDNTVGCVECTSEDHDLCTNGKVCSNDATLANTCVECNSPADCDDDAPVCDGHVCKKCTGAMEDCMGRDNSVCDEVSGACVECTITSEAAKCSGNSCNPATKACTTTPVASVGICEACVADSECEMNHRCVEMSYDGTKLTPVAGAGGFCLKLFSTGCAEPYGAAKINRGSLSGAGALDYCGVNEALASCAAIRAFGRSCAAPDGPDLDSAPDADAALCAATGARCETVNGLANKCTYDCTDDLECPATRPCGNTGDTYCGQ